MFCGLQRRFSSLASPSAALPSSKTSFSPTSLMINLSSSSLSSLPTMLQYLLVTLVLPPQHTLTYWQSQAPYSALTKSGQSQLSAAPAPPRHQVELTADCGFFLPAWQPSFGLQTWFTCYLACTWHNLKQWLISLRYKVVNMISQLVKAKGGFSSKDTSSDSFNDKTKRC